MHWATVLANKWRDKQWTDCKWEEDDDDGGHVKKTECHILNNVSISLQGNLIFKT